MWKKACTLTCCLAYFVYHYKQWSVQNDILGQILCYIGLEYALDNFLAVRKKVCYESVNIYMSHKYSYTSGPML